MKPDWENAPSWAKWLAMDANGAWYWFEREPARRGYSWHAQDGMCRSLAAFHNEWDGSLEPKPSP